MKILFAISSLHCGGIEKSALALLSKLVRQGHDVTLAMAEKSGEFLPFVPKDVRVVEIPYGADVRYENQYGRKRLLLRFLLRFRFLAALDLLRFGRRIAGMNSDQRAIAINQRFCASIPTDGVLYDQALCFSEFTEIVYVADCVKAKRKAVWLHTEQGHGFSDVREYGEYLRRMDTIYCVSDALSSSVMKALPELGGRVKRYHHIVDGDLIRRMADQEPVAWDVPEGVIKILSVGRLARQKGFDLIPEIVRQLNERGHRISWVIVGKGSDRELIQQKIDENGLSDQITLVGVKVNPYPYFKACDIYVQPSRYEGYCLTLAEARMLYKPIVATDFNGAREQLRNGETGIVVPVDVSSLVQAVAELCLDPNLRNAMCESLQRIMR